ncbi:MAG: ABC transporter ATP-binding protein [Treponema sp.]|nr:ABC transporter ATP-binding protein [Treponema sp.]
MSYFKALKIHKKWPSVTVDFSLECDKGTMTCLLGPSGCGKSTVLNIIAGLEENDPVGPSLRQAQDKLGSGAPDDFLIELDGIRIEGLPPARRNIGMVFQSGALFNHLSVGDNVAYGLISKGIKKKEARAQAAEYLKHFDLAGFEKRIPQTLSGGEKQRVALARTLITRPKLVLLDEPFSALDTDLRHRMAEQLRKWQQELGFTAIMVTHDQTEAQTVADKIIQMEKNR